MAAYTCDIPIVTSGGRGNTEDSAVEVELPHVRRFRPLNLGNLRSSGAHLIGPRLLLIVNELRSHVGSGLKRLCGVEVERPPCGKLLCKTYWGGCSSLYMPPGRMHGIQARNTGYQTLCGVDPCYTLAAI